MICFPNAKINLGLYVTGKRQNGYHTLESVFYPVDVCDILEFIEDNDAGNTNVSFDNTGIQIPGNTMSNLCVKTYELLARDFNMPPIKIHLHKMIPVGAGLGGGSSDGAYMLKALNDYFSLNLSRTVLGDYASRLGSDCPFFIQNKPAYVTGRGDVLEEINGVLRDLFIFIVVPSIHISTTEAYQNIIPKALSTSLKKMILLPLSEWKNSITNQFEDYVFVKYPEVAMIKEKLYAHGAMYVSMSGSGSAVYSLFTNPFRTGKDIFSNYITWSGRLA